MIQKRVVITGGTGFLGKHVVEKASHEYYYTSIVEHKYFDLLKERDIKNMYKCLQPDILIHLAASVGGIQYNQKNPAKLLYENGKMGLNIVHEAKKYGKLEKLVCIGSVCMYAQVPPRIPFVEEDIWYAYPEKTNASYGIAKRVLLQTCQSYRQQFGLNAIFLVPTNLYGCEDSFDETRAHVIPMLIKRMVESKEKGDKELKIWGTGNATREFLYADDCADAILLATEKYNKPDPVNIGTSSEIKIKYLAEMIAQKVGYQGKLVFDVSMPDGQPRRYLNVDRAYNEFGFKAKTSLSEGLDKTIEWYLENRR